MRAVTAPGESSRVHTAWVQATELGLIHTPVDDGTAVFVSSLKDGEPLGGVRIDAFDWTTGESLATAETGDDDARFSQPRGRRLAVQPPHAFTPTSLPSQRNVPAVASQT